MAKQQAPGSRDRSETRSRSPSGKKHREKRRRSRSKSRRARDRSRSKGGRRSRSQSRSREKKRERDGRKRSRSRERAKKRSRSNRGKKSRSRRKRSSSRKRSASRAAEKKDKEKEKDKEKDKPVEKKEKERPSDKKAQADKQKREKAAEKNKPRSPSREDERGSPSVQRGSPNGEEKGKEKVGDKTSVDVGKRGLERNGDDRSDSEKASKDLAPDVGEGGKDTEASKDAPPKEPKPPELVKVTFEQRPFGMGPQKDAEGYVVSKVAEGRPADERGVQVGWRLVAVGEEKCKDSSSDAIQALLKNAPLPAIVTFEKPPSDDVPSEAADEEEDEEKDDEEQELDILDVRADQRRNSSSALSNIDDLPVTREPEGLPNPITSWQDAVARGMLNKALLEKLQAAGLKRPTVIQRHAVPLVFHEFGHYDLIAMAQTGSGKTFAFVIPTVARLVLQGAMPRPFFPGKSPGCPLLVILSPTRELAMQTSKEIEVVAKGTSLTQVVIYGGESLKFQQQRIEKAQIDILCATPGRLIDLVDSGKLSLSFVQSVILDEADQMLEQSLEVMCAEILTGRDMPEPSSGRQTLLFSATMPQKIRELCPRILRQERIANLTIGHYGEDQGGSCASIKQILRWCPDEGPQRIQVLIEDLKTYWIRPGKKGRVVIFTNQRLQATHLANALMVAGISCVHLHGKLEQHVREEVFDKFRRGLSDVLVATNVASRGLDFPDISLVVQFNLPQTVDIYTHRIGRTGRVGQVGAALGYMGPKDRRLNDKLVEFLELNKQEIPDFIRPRMIDPRRRPMGSGRSRSRRRR